MFDFSEQNHIIGVFLDITSAYDNVNLPLLRQEMLNLGILVRMTNVICDMFMGY